MNGEQRDIRNTIGERLQKIRNSKKWTQEDVAKRVGVTQPSVAQWESGKRPGRRSKERLEALYEVFIDYETGNMRKRAGSTDSDDSSDAQGQSRYSLNTILYGPPGTGKTYATARRCADICDGDADDLSDEDIHDRYAALVEEGRVEFVTFHQSYGYEEFVEGLRPRTSDGAAGFQLAPTDGVLKRIAERARKAPQLPYVLVIDEINRANVSKVMGELVTLLEEDKREGEPNEIGVTLPHSHERFTLPPNLHILGTMNTADRSIALLDTALRRRFRFEEMAPGPDNLDRDVDGIDLRAVLSAINERLEWLLDRNHLIGHAWLMDASDKAQVDEIMRNKIIPLIVEYFYDDWNKVRAVLGGGNGFVQSKKIDIPPGLGDNAGEDRYRWTIRDSFGDDAYNRLISGSGTADTADTADTAETGETGETGEAGEAGANTRGDRQ